MQLFFETLEGKRVIDYSRHIMEDFFPYQLFEERASKRASSIREVQAVKLCEYLMEESDMDSSPNLNEAALEAPQYLKPAFSSRRNVLSVYNPDDFQKCLFEHLGEKGYESKVSVFYNKAGISRQVFANILSYNKEYTPTKETLYKIIFTLELSYNQAKKLLGTKGYTISRSVKFDVVAGYCLENEIFEQKAIDELLFENCQTTLFSAK